jgi:hypothetical protein
MRNNITPAPPDPGDAGAQEYSHYIRRVSSSVMYISELNPSYGP